MRLLIFIFFLLSQSVFTQPVLNSTDFAETFSANAFRANTSGFSNGSAGENQVWDFSTIVLQPTNLSYSIVPMSSSPDGNLFPTANYCYRFNDAGSIIYNYYYLGEQSMESLGYNFDGAIGIYTNTNIFLQFPYIYNTVINDTYQSFNSSTIHSFTRTYDAYGTLITPFGIFENVIRQVETNEFGSTYYWISTNPFQIILQGNFNENTVLFYQSTALNNFSIDNKDFSVYPNPTNSDVFVQRQLHDSKEKFVTICDALGQIILPSTLLENDFMNISLKNYSSGLYFIRIANSDNQVIFSEKIIKN
ncbi:MAG: T9SS type A sorting domain-containing protein [Flavobacterium sp.]|nr:T9SS type A sorting domain-containing protein [Flavobacterium sp.]